MSLSLIFLGYNAAAESGGCVGGRWVVGGCSNGRWVVGRCSGGRWVVGWWGGARWSGARALLRGSGRGNGSTIISALGV